MFAIISAMYVGDGGIKCYSVCRYKGLGDSSTDEWHLKNFFEVRDHGKPLRVAYAGGTKIAFNASAAYYDGIASSKKMAKAAADYRVTAPMSNHSEIDDPFFKAHRAANRQPA
jgi:hypothetical protein